MQPLDLQGCIIPHLKALTHTILGLEAQECVSIFRVHQALLKIAILLSIYSNTSKLAIFGAQKRTASLETANLGAYLCSKSEKGG